MHVVAFLLAILAIALFTLAALGHGPRFIPAGLACTVAAWVVQLTVSTVDPVTL